MAHGSSVAQRNRSSVTRAVAALLSFAACFGGSLMTAVAVAADRGQMAPYDCWQSETTVKGCAVPAENGQLRLTPSFRASLRFGPDGLAPVLVLGRTKGETVRWLYVRRDGAMAAVMAYDNGAEEFTNGRARSPVGAKIGYIDPSLRLVIPAIYDGAYPFENGVAVVCLGCSLVSKGEHSWFEGGTWGCINPDGRTVAPFRVGEQKVFSEICRP
ncbi:WG repeat-containing protein [Bradyrhizobium sp. HKCCYLS3077]|uniref:WG repeat-containing protein n=1 Tax=Bradyrhizobium sp. HKCCYLS3077 TaxID=3420761 RepID=UPI003EB71B53